MFKNAFYLPKKSVMCLWEQVNGENFYTEIDWTPYVYLPCKKSEADAYTIYGTPVKRKNFKTYSNYEKFTKNNNKNTNVFENEVKFETQFLAERYHGISDEDTPVPILKTFYLDIEVAPKGGFPNTLDPEDPIILISVRDSLTGKTITFGYDEYGKRKYTGKKKDVKYIECDNEELLLKRFLNYVNKYKCDVLSGWNIWSFDLPYIINRCIKLFGKEKGKKWYSKMSPINVVNIWKQKKSDEINIDMGGVTILDYYNVYRWYGKKLERYTLEYVSQKELNVGKLSHSYKDLTEFYKKDWNEFVNYNVIDCERVNDLENKLGYIRLIQALSLLSKAPMKYYNAMTKLIEGAMITHYRRNGLCAPHFYGGHQETFQAAHVKDPQKGMHKWVVDVDITSSYPSHIIALNMSNETFMGKIIKMTEKELITYSRKRNFPAFTWLKEENGEWKPYKIKGKKLVTFNKLFKKGLLSIAPCGSIFSTNKTGVVAEVEKNVFFKRKEVKGKMKKLDKKVSVIENSGDPYDKKEIQEKKDRVRELNSLQLALKIFINAFFGILAVPYSRYFNTAIAEAITACGRHTIKQGEIFCNELLNNPTESLLDIANEIGAANKVKNITDENYVSYIDTDSLFVRLGSWIENQGCKEQWDKLTDEEKIKYIKRISSEMEKYIDDKIFNKTQLIDYNSQVKDFKISFKQEIIAKTALFIKKKKYAYWLRDKEGAVKDEMSVTGLEIVRSDSSEAVRPRLKEIMELVMKQEPDKKIKKKINDYKKELLKLSPYELAANIGVNNINKYIKKNGPKKGTPWHVKGVYNYRLLLKYLKISDKYEDIHEGLKAKVVYVKPNPWNVETITFHDWPKEFDTIVQFDKKQMIEKFFIQKIRFLLEPLKKEDILDTDDTIDIILGL